MATVQELKATARPKGGKGAARAARRSGRVPGVIYGENKPPLMVTLDHDELRQRIYAGRFLTTLYNLDVDGTKHRVIPRDFQLDAIKDLPMHVDFLRVAEGATIRVKVAVHVLNADQSPGVKRGGAVNIVTHTVDVMCPAEIDSGINRCRYFEPRHQSLEAPHRRYSAAQCSRDRASGHDAGHRRAAVRLRRRNEGCCRSRRCRRCGCCCRRCCSRRRCCTGCCTGCHARSRSGCGRCRAGCRRRAGEVRQEVRRRVSLLASVCEIGKAHDSENRLAASGKDHAQTPRQRR